MEMPTLCEEANGSGVVEAWRKDGQQVVDEEGLVVEVKLEGSVVQLNVSNFGNNVLEVGLLPGFSGMGHHGQDSVVILFILVVQEHQLRPEMGLFCSTQYLREGRREKDSS